MFVDWKIDEWSDWIDPPLIIEPFLDVLFDDRLSGDDYSFDLTLFVSVLFDWSWKVLYYFWVLVFLEAISVVMDRNSIGVDCM